MFQRLVLAIVFGFSLSFVLVWGFWVGLTLFWFRFGNTKAYFLYFFPNFFFSFIFFLHVAKLSSSESLQAFPSERDSSRDQLVDGIASHTSQKILVCIYVSSMLQEARSILFRQDGQC